jgi:hypothetical protein
LIEQIIRDEEFGRTRGPLVFKCFGLGLCGPTVMRPNAEDRQWRFLPHVLNADEIS